VEISRIQEPELAKLIDMAAAEGWNPGIHDAQTFFRVDPEGFMGVHEAGALIGGGAIVRHNDQFGFMGLFLMASEFRGKGIGRKLWYARRDRLLERLGANAGIGMDGVSAMVGFYNEGGFEPQYVSSRFQATPKTLAEEVDPNLTSVLESDFEAIRELDPRCFPGERQTYLSAWLQQNGAHQLCYRHRNGSLAGFGTMRPCIEGWKVGPLFADKPEVARTLLNAFIATAAGAPLYIDVPSCNPVAIQLCQSFDMQPVFECTRMYFGKRPTYDSSLIYGLTSFELG